MRMQKMEMVGDVYVFIWKSEFCFLQPFFLHMTIYALSIILIFICIDDLYDEKVHTMIGSLRYYINQ